VTYLLDTHVWLWMVTAPDRLGSMARTVIDGADNRLLLSAASSWEIAIKQAITRLVLPEPAEVFVPERMRITGVVGLAVEHAHALRVGSLPAHHRDPFDRLLVAQAQVEAVPLLTADPIFERYDVEVIPAR